jgi:hypothetical protein
MIERVGIRVTDIDAALPLYELLPCEQLDVAHSGDDAAATRRLHLAVFVASRDDVDRFWRRATAAGFRDDGAPGMRPQYASDYYGAFVLDPDGNSVEAVTSDADHVPGEIDHLWLRHPDLARVRQEWLALGQELGTDRPDERVQFRGTRDSLSFVHGEPPTSGVTLGLAGGGSWRC